MVVSLPAIIVSLLGLALAGAVGGLYAYSRLSVRRTEARFPPTGKFVTVEGVRLHYVIEGSGRPVVLLHGAGTSLLDFSMTMLGQAATEFQVIAFDRPGHGFSGQPDREVATPQVQARLLRGALRELGIATPVLVAHSWGGAVALAYAIDYPDDVSGIVLLGTVAYAEGYPPAPRIMRVPAIPVIGGILTSVFLVVVGRAAARSMFEDAFRPNSIAAVAPEFVEASTALSLRPSQFSANATQVRHTRSSLIQMEPQYGKISVPVAIVTGEADPHAQPQLHSYPLHEAIPHSQLVVLPETGHMIPHTRPDAVIQTVRAIWDQVQAGKRDVIVQPGRPDRARGLGDRCLGGRGRDRGA